MGCKDGTGCGANGEACGERKQEVGSRKQEEGSDLRPLTGWDVAAEFVGRAFEEIAERRLLWAAELERANKAKGVLVESAVGLLPMLVHLVSGDAKPAQTPVSEPDVFTPNPVADFVIEWAKLPQMARVTLLHVLSTNLDQLPASLALHELFEFMDKHGMGKSEKAEAEAEGKAPASPAGESESESEKAQGEGRKANGPATPATEAS